MTTWLSFPPSRNHLSSCSLWPTGYHSTTYAAGSGAVSGLLQEMVTLCLCVVTCTSRGGLAKRKSMNMLFFNKNWASNISPMPSQPEPSVAGVSDLQYLYSFITCSVMGCNFCRRGQPFGVTGAHCHFTVGTESDWDISHIVTAVGHWDQSSL